MALDFPNSPSIGDTFSGSGTTWVWDGTSWTVQSPTATFAATTELADHESATTSVHGIADTSTLATQSYADTAAATAAAGVVDAAPATLDTLNELAAALGDDANFATTVTTSLAGKVSKSGDTITGDLTVEGAVATDSATVSGNLGVGTAAPARALHTQNGSSGGTAGVAGVNGIVVESSGSTGVQILGSNTGAGYVFFSDSDGQAPGRIAYNHASDFLNVYTGSAERLRIDSAGRIGVGTTSPLAKVHAAGDVLLDAGGSTDRATTVRVLGTGDTGTSGSWRSAIKFIPDGTYGFTSHITFNNFANDYYNSTLTERMRITSNGRVGIGTTSPSKVLHVKGSSLFEQADTGTGHGYSIAVAPGDGTASQRGSVAFFGTFYDHADTGDRRVADITAGFSTGTWLTEYMAFHVGTGGANDAALLTTERVRITSAGRVGIGTTAPSQMLEVYGASPYIRVSNTDETNAGIEFTDAQAPNNQNAAVYFSSSTNALQFSTNSTERLRITSGGAVGIGTTSPEATLDVAGDIKSSGVVTSAAGALDQAINFSAAGSVLDNLPARVHPAEQLLKQAVWWIDAAHSSASGQSVSNLGWGGSALDAQVGSSGSADSNDPKYLDWQGENYVYLPGLILNYLSVPTSTALDITADLDIRAHVSADTLSSGLAQALVARWGGAGNKSYIFFISNAGRPLLYWSTDGTNEIFKIGDDLPFADGQDFWVRVILDVDNGFGAYDLRFYTSTDGTTWTQLGSPISDAATSIYNPSYMVTMGMWAASGAPFAGKFYRAQVLNGINGTPVLDIDCSQITSGADTSFTALTGQTVTINRSTSGRKTVGVVHPRWLFGTDDYMEVPDNNLIDFGASDSFTVVYVGRVWSTPGSAARALQKGSVPSYSLRNSGTSNAMSIHFSDGTNAQAATSSYTFGALSVMAGVVDRSTQTVVMHVDGTASSPASISAVGDLSSSAPLRINTVPAAYLDSEFTAAAIWRRALTAGEIATLNSYYQGRG